MISFKAEDGVLRFFHPNDLKKLTVLDDGRTEVQVWTSDQRDLDFETYITELPARAISEQVKRFQQSNDSSRESPA